MKASIPSRHHPPHAAQKPLIWLEFSLVRVARRGAAVAVAVAGVAAIQVLCCEGDETEESYWGKSQTPNPKTQIPNVYAWDFLGLGIWILGFGIWDLLIQLSGRWMPREP